WHLAGPIRLRASRRGSSPRGRGPHPRGIASAEAGARGERFERGFRSRPQMRDDLCRSDGAEPATISERPSAPKCIKKSRGELVSCPGRVNDTGNGRRVHDMHLTIPRDNTTLFRARERADSAPVVDALQDSIERLDFEERLGLILVGKQNVES